jgi:glyoxylase-like metal-dependent hydrolase (beta-lactamase superfamily II)
MKALFLSLGGTAVLCGARLLAQTPAVEHEVTSLIRTNCYLVYDNETREAALIDPGGTVETLLAAIAREKLQLRYILLTHAHPDHVAGIPAIKAAHPHAKLAMSREEFEDGPALYSRWETVFPAAMAEKVRSSPGSLTLFSFPYASLGTPDLFLRDGAVHPLSTLTMRVIATPGHTRGGVCLLVGNRLFSGDTLFQGRIGSTQLPGSSREQLQESVKRLYAILPDSVIVLPGHGKPTEIGREKQASTGLN